MTDDLISRKAAINLLEKWSGGYDYIETEKESAIKEFQDLPSAQPNLQPTCNQLATDCISRQAAIKAIEDLPNCYNGFSDTYDKSCIIGVLEELPSAQPEITSEIVRCRECKRWDMIPDPMADYGLCERWGRLISTRGTYFCKDGKRRDEK